MLLGFRVCLDVPGKFSLLFNGLLFCMSDAHKYAVLRVIVNHRTGEGIFLLGGLGDVIFPGMGLMKTILEWDPQSLHWSFSGLVQARKMSLHSQVLLVPCAPVLYTCFKKSVIVCLLTYCRKWDVY